MKTKSSSYPLRLPLSLKTAVERLSKEDGTSINHFVVIAVAEKVSAIDTAAFFASRAANADEALFIRHMNRKGGEPPQPGDEMPEGMKRTVARRRPKTKTQ